MSFPSGAAAADKSGLAQVRGQSTHVDALGHHTPAFPSPPGRGRGRQGPQGSAGWAGRGTCTLCRKGAELGASAEPGLTRPVNPGERSERAAGSSGCWRFSVEFSHGARRPRDAVRGRFPRPLASGGHSAHPHPPDPAETSERRLTLTTFRHGRGESQKLLSGAPSSSRLRDRRRISPEPTCAAPSHSPPRPPGTSRASSLPD